MKVDTEGPIRILTLDRPEVLNALNSAQWSALLAEVRAAEDDDAIRVIFIRAEGRAFCAGNDIKETSAFSSKGEARSYFLDLMVPALAAMASSRLPIVAAAHGMALGAGLELLQFCDVVVAGESTRFQLPETSIGLWATVFLGSAAYSANRRLTQWLALTAEPITAQQAMEGQLISRVVPDEQVEPEARRIASIIATRGPRATAFSKTYTSRTMLTEALPVVRQALSDLIDSTLWGAEGREGVTAFLEKRAPDFVAPARPAPDADR
jgi:enoyl-CoA hydratase/carnithine racemase